LGLRRARKGHCGSAFTKGNKTITKELQKYVCRSPQQMESLVVMDNRQVSVQELEVVLQGRAGGDGLLEP
jgi:hypothetical protein